MAETKDLQVEKIQIWKERMEKKGCKVNLGKTKFMKCEARFESTGNSGKCWCKFIENALVRIVLSVSAINAISGFMEGVVVYLVNYRMWMVCKRLNWVCIDNDLRIELSGGILYAETVQPIQAWTTGIK